MSEMLAMGDYGAYVWGSFGLTLVVLVICIVQGRRRHAQVLRTYRRAFAPWSQSSETQTTARMLAVGLAAAGLVIATALTLRAFQENMMFFVEISEVEKGNYPADRNFRVGGLVVDGSVRREPGELEVQFDLTDLDSELTVSYEGVLPDLFREGQGIIAHGRLNDTGVLRCRRSAREA